MTTIVYHHASKSLGVDSRISTVYDIVTDKANKWFVAGDDMIFAAGNCGDIHKLEWQWESGQFSDLECDFFLIREKKCFYGYVEKGGLQLDPLSYDFAIGSGGHWAMAALDFGCTLTEAINYTKTRDKGTGGEIHIFDVMEVRFSETPPGPK